MARRLLSCLIALTFIVSSTGSPWAAQASQPVQPPALVSAVPRLLPEPPARPAPSADAATKANATIAAVLASAKQVAAAGGHTCALTATGGVKCWGVNVDGELGDGTTLEKHSPVDVSGLTSGVTAISLGWRQSCALTAGGGVKCWGYNSNGQLGDGTTVEKHSPVDVSGLTDGVIAIAAGHLHTCALTTGGRVKCWGGNSTSQLGDGTTVEKHSPVDVSGLTSSVTAIAAGYDFTCVLKAEGGVMCWGNNDFGQLGDGTTILRATPVDVSGLTGRVTAITGKNIHACALTAAGGVMCWGFNAYGQLGDGTTLDKHLPVDVSGLTNGVAAIAAGAWHTCAVTAGGGAKCWGENNTNQLGDGTTLNRSSPVDVNGLTNGVAAIAAGAEHTCALTAGGGLKCWGWNKYGNLGDGTTTNRSMPVDVVGYGGGSSSTISGRMRDAAGTPLAGVIISVSAAGSAITDGNGDYSISGLTAGTYTLTPSRSGYTFTPPSRTVTVPPDATGQDFTANLATLAASVQQFAADSNARLSQVSAEAHRSAQDGDYFAIQRQQDEIRLVADMVLDTVSVVGTSFKGVEKVKDLTKMKAPGVMGSGWGHVIRLRDQYEPARDAFRKALFTAPLTEETAWLAAQEHMKGAAAFYAASALDSAAEDLVTDGAIKRGLEIGLRSDLGLQNRNYPALLRLAGVFQQDINNTGTTTVVHLPNLTPGEEQSYQSDLHLRNQANIILAFALERRVLPLHIAQDARESEPSGVVPWFGGFLSKYFLRCAAGLCCDGPGVLALEAGVALTDLYQNHQRLNEDTQMMTLGAEAMGGALDTQKQIYLNAVNGLDNIVARITPQIPAAVVSSIINRSIGEYKLFGRWIWWERSAYSEVNLHNGASFGSDMYAIANYGSTGLLGTSYQPLSQEGVVSVAGGQDGTAYVRYTTDGQGATPDKGSNIDLSILGSTDTGTYFVQKSATTWDPIRVPTTVQAASASFAPTAQEADDAPAIPYPVRSTVEVRDDSLSYVPHVWIDNPFTTTLAVTITQPLPSDVQILNANGGVQVGNSLTWSRTISPQASIEITHVVTFGGQAGRVVEYPVAQLEMSDAVNSATFIGNPVAFRTLTPLTGEAEPPRQTLVNQEVSIPITITNHSSSPVAGTIKLRLTRTDGTVLHEGSEDAVVPGLATVAEARILRCTA